MTCIPLSGIAPFTKIGARRLPYIACLKRISPLAFIPPVPYPPLWGTFPSRGRLTIRKYRYASPAGSFEPFSPLNTSFRHRHYLYSAALLYFMRRASTPHSSFGSSFRKRSRVDTPRELPLNLTTHLIKLSQTPPIQGGVFTL